MCETVRPIEETHPFLAKAMVEIANGRTNLSIYKGNLYQKRNGAMHIITFKTKPNDPCTCGSGKKFKKCCG